MRAWDKIYITVSDWLIRVVTENKSLLVLLFVLNLTCLVNFYMTIDFRGSSFADLNSFVSLTLYLLFEIFVLISILHNLPKIFARLFVTLSVIFFCVDAFTLIMYRSVFDKGMFQIILDTNLQEAAEYVADYSSLLAPKLLYVLSLTAVLALLIKAGIVLADFLLRRRIRFLRFIAFIFALVGLTLMIGANADFFVKKNPVSVFRISFLIPRAFNEIREYREVYNNLDAAQIEITRNDSELPWVIFILGESTNRYHMSLYGYDKPTTPNLQRRLEQEGLILFTDCISGATETMPACQRLFTFYANGGGGN